jgi:hypothetical protein
LQPLEHLETNKKARLRTWWHIWGKHLNHLFSNNIGNFSYKVLVPKNIDKNKKIQLEFYYLYIIVFWLLLIFFCSITLSFSGLILKISFNVLTG